MITKEAYAAHLLGPLHQTPAVNAAAEVFMPANIALVKYWGKRPGPLNLPLVSSLSYTLDGYGTTTRIARDGTDGVTLNGAVLGAQDADFIKIQSFLDLFRAPGERYAVMTANNIPTAAGVASSASGFAALTAAIVRLKGWDMPLRTQSMLARLGSGSATRSFWPGLVLWRKGAREDGMDCEAAPVSLPFSFGMAVLRLNGEKKKWSSRQAMEISLATSPLAAEWPLVQQQHLDAALGARDFATLGAVAEANAELMHRVIATGTPPISFDLPETAIWKSKVREWRAGGMPVYFTQDAGPNLKLIFPPEIKARIEAELTAQGIDYFAVSP